MTKAASKTVDVIDEHTGELTTITENDVTRYLADHDYATSILTDLEVPPAIFLNETAGAMLALRFRSVRMVDTGEYGPSALITFVAEAGHAVVSKAGPVDIISGEVYSMHLFSQTLNDTFVDLAPEFDELVIIRYCGKRASGSRVDKDGSAVEYHLFTMMCPDRPVVVDECTWASVPKVGKSK